MTMLRASSLALSLLFLSGCNDAGTEAASREQGQPVPVEALVIAPRAQMLTTDLPGRIAPSAWPRCARGWPASSRSATSPKVRWSKKAICCSPSSPLPCRRLWSAIAARWPAHRPGQAGRIPVHRYEPLVKVEAVSRRVRRRACRTANRARQRGVCRADVRTAQLDWATPRCALPLVDA